MNPLTPAGARMARDLAEQRFASAFDAKSSAASRLCLVRRTAESDDVIATAADELVNATSLYADARAALDQAVRAEQDILVRQRGITWLEPRP